MQSCLHKCLVCYPSAQVDETASAFRFDDGAPIWDEIMGKETENTTKTKFPESKIRVHVGLYKALVNSVQKGGTKRYGAILGQLWKGNGTGDSSLWRGTVLIMSSNFENLAKVTQKRMEELDALRLLGIVAVDFSTSLTEDQPDVSLVKWVEAWEGWHVSNVHVVVHASISSAQTKGLMCVFQSAGADEGYHRVWLPFLSKRLANETVHAVDADQPGSASLFDMVNEVVSEPCTHACMHTCTIYMYILHHAIYINVTNLWGPGNYGNFTSIGDTCNETSHL